MNMQQRIEHKLVALLQPAYWEVINESSGHNVPKGSETHFKVIIASPVFEGRSPVDRHRMVYEILSDEMKNGVHALSLQTLTPSEWESRAGEAQSSPPCLGKEKHGVK
jgi:BolA family transcriptional regulator, general stress-responsive regulator